MSKRTLKEVMLPSFQTQPFGLVVVVIAWAIVIAIDIVFWVNLTTSSLWLDELWTAYYTDPSLGLIELLLNRMPTDTNPPIYYVIAHLWQRILGPGDASLRALSVVAATSIPVILFFGSRRFLSHDARLFLLLLSASSGPLISNALNARPYAILMLLSVLTCLVFHKLQIRRDNSDNNLARDYVQLVIACVVISLTHWYGFFLTAGLILTLLAHKPSRRDTLATFAAGVAVVAIVGVYIVWHYPQVTQVYYSEDTWARNSARFKPLVLVEIVAKGLARPLGYGVELVIIGFFLASTLAFRWRAGNPSRQVAPVLASVSAPMGPFISAVLIGALAALVVSVSWRPLLSQRNLLAFAPAVWLIAAFFFEKLIAIHGKVAKIAVLALMTFLLAYRAVDSASLFDSSNEEWKTSAAFVAALLNQ